MGNDVDRVLSRVTLSSTVTAAKDQISSDLGGEVVILNLADGTYYGLDSVGARIWAMIQEPISLRRVHEALVGEYDVAPETCQRELIALVADLNARDLIEIANGNE